MASISASSCRLLTLTHRRNPSFYDHNHKNISNSTLVPPLPLATVSSKHSREQRAAKLLRASFEGIPQELSEESKFVPLTADDPVYGPPALLLLGFEKTEIQRILQFLKEMDGEFLKIIRCTEDMLSLSIWDAMHVEQSDLETVKVPNSLPRMCILSGLTGEEMLMFIDAFPETGLEHAIFAALVPNSANKLLEEVVEEIMGDHELLSVRQSN